MEKKRWGLIYSGLCLALVFSVSSVDAQKICEPCQRCDRDGDGEIQNTGSCIKKCAPDGVVDDDDHDAEENNCSVEDEDDGNFNSLFTVEFMGPEMKGGPAHWIGSTSGGRTINLPVFNELGVALDLSFFAGEITDGNNCFNTVHSVNMTVLFAASLQSKNVKGPDDQAIGMFWFDGKTNHSEPEERLDVGYLLELFGTFGTFDEGEIWPGTNTLTMTKWKMSVETSTKGGRKKACTEDDGSFRADPPKEIISVEQTQ